MSRRSVEQVCDDLCERGIAATRYHAGLSPDERERNQADFIYDRKPVMVATNAFGMGIDKSNVSYVVHYNLPLSLENYYQEAGRAGRDGTAAECLLLYSPADVHTAEFLLSRTERSDLTPEQLEQLRQADDARLRQMVFYATTTNCLRSFILRYFGEEAPAYCGNCSNCLADFEEADERTNALKIVTAWPACASRPTRRERMPRALARSLIVDILRGSRAARVLERGYNALSTYGTTADVPGAADSLADRRAHLPRRARPLGGQLPHHYPHRPQRRSSCARPSPSSSRSPKGRPRPASAPAPPRTQRRSARTSRPSRPSSSRPCARCAPGSPASSRFRPTSSSTTPRSRICAASAPAARRSCSR